MSQTRPSLDTVFELLADRRRRYALYCLAAVGEDRVLDLDDVAARVAEWEREWEASGDGEDAGDSDSGDRRERVRVDLHHNHLPRLADAGLVDYDARTGTVRNWEAPSLDRWVPDESDELPHLRALLANENVMGVGNDGGNEDATSSDPEDGDDR
ncbi:DUF7344 domain-containing protein [Halorussus sp. AFM4]|uniref:DUF7344 domain-containing protein n=1 Tax=Halorussus sp. AFM4 TaxID=3421651 RepID=UPI003EB851AD